MIRVLLLWRPAVVDALSCFCRWLAVAGSREEVVTGNCSSGAVLELVRWLEILSGPCDGAEACLIWLGLASTESVFWATASSSSPCLYLNSACSSGSVSDAGSQCPLLSLESSVNSIIMPSSGDFVGHFSLLDSIIAVSGSPRRCLACMIRIRPCPGSRSVFDSCLPVRTQCLRWRLSQSSSFGLHPSWPCDSWNAHQCSS